MSYKDILVFLDGSTDNDARMEFAFSLARAHGARLTGVDVDAAAAFEGEWAERAKSLAGDIPCRRQSLGRARPI
ncbi:universal stress protein [Mesorhizobium sp.]|uniref:universal stress protein n=1 Tax=Mesorhizobium sp. TaxID=1871066 RepID=UPI0025C3A3BE|nr:universal stress protein [Mesorhizobium sp.]